MKERPILFSAPMIRAILDGRKTHTRRVVKPQPNAGIRRSVFVDSGLEDGHGREIKRRYGQPSDRLWVREAHFINDYRGAQVPESERTDCEVIYRADPLPCWEGEEQDIPWRPSIHMPRWASRITLEITDVRLERLQEISEVDAKAEGAQLMAPHFGTFVSKCEWTAHKSGFSHLNGFRFIWEDINGHDSWHANPWVWVIEFKRLEAGGTG